MVKTLGLDQKLPCSNHGIDWLFFKGATDFTFKFSVWNILVAIFLKIYDYNVILR